MSRLGQGMPKDELKAIGYLKQSADKNYLEATTKFGDRLLAGEGVVKDVAQGLEYLHKASAAGHLEAKISLGRYYIYKEKQNELGLAYLQEAESIWPGKYWLAIHHENKSNNLNLEAQIALKYRLDLMAMKEVPLGVASDNRFHLAEFYYYGFGTTQNNASAAMTLEPAIKTDKNASNFYAWLLYRGEGVAADKPRAVQMWLENSTYPDLYGYSTNGLAQAYAAGERVALDKRKAQYYLNQTTWGGAGMYWKAKLKAKRLAGSDCVDIMGRFLSSEETKGRYQSVIASAYLDDARCIFEKFKNKKKESYSLTTLMMTLSSALSAGAPGASELQREIAIWRADGGVLIGMTTAQVLATKWGKPNAINRTTNASGSTEQWVYGAGNYLYFSNGLLQTIQN